VAYFSDRFQRRGIPTIIFGLVSIVGYAVLMSPVSNGVKYFGCFLVAMGLYVIVGIPLAWLPSNNPRYGKRTTASGLQLTIGNCSGIMVNTSPCLCLHGQFATATTTDIHALGSLSIQD
jgi:hypothetical protein